MEPISRPVIRKDHTAKITGQEKYVGDFRFASDGGEILTAGLVRTDKAHAEIRKVAVPPLPESYYYIDGHDAPKNISYYPLNDTAVILTEEEAETERDAVVGEYVAELDMPLDRTGVKYRKQVCCRLLDYLLYEEFTPIRFDDIDI